VRVRNSRICYQRRNLLSSGNGFAEPTAVWPIAEMHAIAIAITLTAARIVRCN